MAMRAMAGALPTEKAPRMNPRFVEKWFLRCKDLVDSYRPDLL